MQKKQRAPSTKKKRKGARHPKKREEFATVRNAVVRRGSKIKKKKKPVTMHLAKIHCVFRQRVSRCKAGIMRTGCVPFGCRIQAHGFYSWDSWCYVPEGHFHSCEGPTGAVLSAAQGLTCPFVFRDRYLLQCYGPVHDRGDPTGAVLVQGYMPVVVNDGYDGPDSSLHCLEVPLLQSRTGRRHPCFGARHGG